MDKLDRVYGLYKDSMHLEIEGQVGVLRTGENMDQDEWTDIDKEDRCLKLKEGAPAKVRWEWNATQKIMFQGLSESPLINY